MASKSKPKNKLLPARAAKDCEVNTVDYSHDRKVQYICTLRNDQKSKYWKRVQSFLKPKRDKSLPSSTVSEMDLVHTIDYSNYYPSIYPSIYQHLLSRAKEKISIIDHDKEGDHVMNK
jgi:hypothetical protein